jgi:uncharacterized cupredoxin-like copper-binding protein
VEVQMIGKRGMTALLAAGALFAVPLVGCGGDDDEGGEATEASEAATTAAAGAGGTVNLSGTDYKFDPSDPTVKAGEVTFVLKNDGQTTHSIEVEGPNGEAELEQDLAPGESGELKVDLSEPGTYEFYCPVDDHKGLGMEGEVTVQ